MQACLVVNWLCPAAAKPHCDSLCMRIQQQWCTQQSMAKCLLFQESAGVCQQPCTSTQYSLMTTLAIIGLLLAQQGAQSTHTKAGQTQCQITICHATIPQYTLPYYLFLGQLE